MREIWPELKIWIDAGEAFALATVVETRKPSPRGVGSVLAISEGGDRFIGSVSAGCVESEVIELAKACLEDGKARWAEFGPDEGFPWEISFSCGGKVRVRVERFRYEAAFVKALKVLFESNGTGLWMSGPDGQSLLLEDGDFVGQRDEWSEEALIQAEELLTAGGETREIERDSDRILLRMISKPSRLFIIGAGHISLRLVSFARSLDYQAIVIDPRAAFAKKERFEATPDKLVCSWPKEGLSRFELGSQDSVVALTHDPKIDDQALEAALRSGCEYVGALGSRLSHQARLKRLAASGIEEGDLARIHGPVGLDIGSRTPAEIALSIMAELIQKKNAGANKTRAKGERVS